MNVLRNLSLPGNRWTRCIGTRFDQFLPLSRREFWQKINEQHLAKELQDIATSAREGETADTSLFDPKAAAEAVARSSLPNADEAGFDASRRTKPWLHYESLRGQTYPSGGSAPRYQDLTHEDAQRLQEMYMRKKMMDRKLLWLKQADLPNPQRDAKLAMRARKKREEEEKAAGPGGDMYPVPFQDVHPGSRKLQKMEESARLDELESRFRARIRQQKVENARIVKANKPQVGHMVVDPIQRHVHRRLVRQRVKIHQGLETFLTQNSAQLLYEHLGGAAVSIVRICAKKPRATQEIQPPGRYSLSSNHDPEWVQRQLNIAAPKLRSQLALKVNLGQTPRIKFVPYTQSQEVRRRYIWQFAKAIQDRIPVGGGGKRFDV